MAFVAAAVLLTAGACHTEEDCRSEVMPAGIELEVVPTRVVTDSGCEGLGASLDDEPRTYTTGEPVDVGAHNKCLADSFVAPEVSELYGVSIDFCYGDSNGFTCEGQMAGCAEQEARLTVGLIVDGVPAVGTSNTTPYYVYIAAEPNGDCPRVDCEQELEATTTRR
jgi:hypothetical protein